MRLILRLCVCFGIALLPGCEVAVDVNKDGGKNDKPGTVDPELLGTWWHQTGEYGNTGYGFVITADGFISEANCQSMAVVDTLDILVRINKTESQVLYYSPNGSDKEFASRYSLSDGKLSLGDLVEFWESYGGWSHYGGWYKPGRAIGKRYDAGGENVYFEKASIGDPCGVPFPADDIYEPDDVPSSASVLAVNGSQEHTFNKRYDADWIRFNIAVPGEYVLTIEPLECGVYGYTQLYRGAAGEDYMEYAYFYTSNYYDGSVGGYSYWGYEYGYNRTVGTLDSPDCIYSNAAIFHYYNLTADEYSIRVDGEYNSIGSYKVTLAGAP